MLDNDICVMCGKLVSEGTAICGDCKNKIEEVADTNEPKEAEELKDIVAILDITAGTDFNIKRAMEGILNIANRLERKGKIERIF